MLSVKHWSIILTKLHLFSFLFFHLSHAVDIIDVNSIAPCIHPTCLESFKIIQLLFNLVLITQSFHWLVQVLTTLERFVHKCVYLRNWTLWRSACANIVIFRVSDHEKLGLVVNWICNTIPFVWLRRFHDSWVYNCPNGTTVILHNSLCCIPEAHDWQLLIAILCERSH